MPYLKQEDNPLVKKEVNPTVEKEGNSIVKKAAIKKRDRVASQCMLCGYVSFSAKALKSHMRNVHGGKKKEQSYTCFKCGHLARNSFRLKRHLKGVHENIRKCNWCDFEGVVKEVNKHVTEQHKNCKLSCKFCSFSTFVHHYMQQHIHSMHDKVLGEMCDQCDYRCSRKSVLFDHKKYVHEKIAEQCNQCSYKISRPKDLYNHIRRVHGKEPYNVPRISCKLCSYSATKPSMIKKHLYFVHHQLYACEWCSFTSQDNVELKEHLKSMHADRLNICSYCEYTTFRMSDLNHHIKSVHDKNKDILCVKCDFKCYRKFQLQEHFKVAHTQLYDEFCDACDFSCQTKKQLNYHKRKTCIKSNPNKKTRKWKNKNLRKLSEEFLAEECTEVEEVKYELPDPLSPIDCGDSALNI